MISNISLITKIFKLNLNAFITTDLNEKNLIEYHPIINEILDSFVAQKTEFPLKLQEAADTILNLCLDVFLKNDSYYEVLLKYFKECSAHCSSEMFGKLFNVYLVNFVKLAQTKEIHLKNKIPADFNELSVKFSQLSIENYNDKEICFLESFFTIIAQSGKFSKLNFKQIEFFVDTTLNVLYEVNDNSGVSKMCINAVSNICHSDSSFKDMVLEKSFKKLKDAAQLNDTSEKKRLESFIQDSNLSLLTSLAEFFMPIGSNQSKIEYLKLTEFWHMIQDGLSHTNSLTRKRALYLLKRTTDIASVNKVDINSNFSDVFEKDDKKVYLYDSKSKLWSEYFLCLEMMEETSVHIIKPCLATALSLIEAVKAHQFHFSWILVLLNRAFLHDSKCIVRWGIKTFLQSNFHLLGTSSTYFYLNRFILGPFILAIGESYLFQKTEDNQYEGTSPILAKLLESFFKSYFTTMPSSKFKTQFLEELTCNVCNISWSSTNLLYFSNIFACLETDISMSSATFMNLSKILTWSTSTHDVFCRSAIQTIIVNNLIKHMNANTTNDELLTNFINILNIVSTKECLNYKNSTWNLTVSFFSNLETENQTQLLTLNLNKELDMFINEENSSDYTNKTMSRKIAKLLLILSDTQLKEVYEKMIGMITEKLVNCNKYVYGSAEKVEKCLMIFNRMLSYVTNSKFNDYKANSYEITQKVYNETFTEILDYILRKSTYKDFSYKNLTFYTEILKNIFNFKNVSPEFKSTLEIRFKNKVLKNFYPQIISSIIGAGFKTEKSFSVEWKKLVAVYLLASVVENFNCDDIFEDFISNNSLVTQLIEMKIKPKSELVNLKRDLLEELIDDLIKNYSQYNGQYFTKLWTVYDFILRNSKIDKRSISDEDFKVLLQKFKDTLDLISPHCLASLIKSARNFFAATFRESQILLVEVFDGLFKILWDMRDDAKNFNESYTQYLKVLFNPKNLQNDSDGIVQDFILKVTKSLLDRKDEKPGISKPLVTKIIQMLSKLDRNYNESFIDVLMSFLTFGDVQNRAKKHMKDVEIYIESLGETFGTNELFKAEYLHDSFIRISTLNYLLTSKTLDEKFFDTLIVKLIEKDQKMSEGNVKFYTNSLFHRERFRLLQTVLILLPKLAERNHEAIMSFCEKALLVENQPSLRALTEWIYIRILISRIDKIDISSLWSKVGANLESKKIGYAFSWLNILSHVAPFIPENNKVTFFNTFIPYILSQVLSTNFQVRTFVEALLVKIYNMIIQPFSTNTKTGLNDPSFTSDPRIKTTIAQIVAIIKPAFEDKDRHANKMIRQFSFQFNPLDDYSVETIYFIFPSLYGIIEEELITVEAFLSIVLDKQMSEIKSFDCELDIGLPMRLRNVTHNLAKNSSNTWQFPTFKNESETTITLEDIQKKIIPWQNLIPNQDDQNDSVKDLSTKNKDLVLMASLIDKSTNLGGICRTCEIFGVKELVLGSLRMTEDKLFRELAATADKWLNIKEVPPKNLKTYLAEMKCYGYKLIGIEQTANSHKLNEFTFPSKSVLVLGNEKEGIPIDIIQLLDVCLEIPQLGVIRSLNVHVSAAIAVWEYTKQSLNCP